MKSLKLKIPPPAWFLLCAALMWLVAQYVPVSLPNYQHTAIFFSGLAVAIIGGAVAVSALWVIHQAKTTYSPFRPQHTAKLVTWGPNVSFVTVRFDCVGIMVGGNVGVASFTAVCMVDNLFPNQAGRANFSPKIRHTLCQILQPSKALALNASGEILLEICKFFRKSHRLWG
ncbi:hypothetical protein [Mannheimia haemolytica]